MNTNTTITVSGTTEVLLMDKKAAKVQLAPERTGSIHISKTFDEVKVRYYKGLYQKPLISYVDGMAIQEIPEAFNRLVIQIWKMYFTPKLKAELFWATMNLKFTRLICKEPEMDIIIQKGDLKALNSVVDALNKNITENFNNNAIEDNLKRIGALYTEDIRKILNLKDTRNVLTFKFETKMMDAIRKYGKDYGISLPQRTEYDSEYVAFKKDLRPQASNNTFKESLVIYEDPADQKEFMDHSHFATLPRSRKEILQQMEELVTLHQTFIQLMYLKSLDIDLKDPNDDLVAQDACYTKLLNYRQAEQDYKYFCKVNNIPFDPMNLILN